jgi:choline monooxygenase
VVRVQYEEWVSRDAALVEIVRAFDPSVPIERAWMPPSSWYVDTRVFELERRATFWRHWQPVARREELAEPGQFVTGCSQGEPWVVVNDGDTLRAFSNVCRHKGREVVTGSGKASKLVCGYHAWTYDLTGRLRKAPRLGGIQDFNRDDMGLVPLGVDTWGPWVFIAGDPNTTPMKELHPEIDRHLEAGGWSCLQFAGRASWEIECNWKVYVDNYLDGGYHVPHMHPSLDAQLDMSTYTTELFARGSIQSAAAATERDERIDYAPASRIGERAIYAWTHPAFMINRYGPCMDTNRVVPLGVNRCRVDYEFYFEETGEHAARFVEASIAQADVTQREDISICESVQRGLRSRHYDRGRYCPTLERSEHQFHTLLRADFDAALTGREIPDDADASDGA